MCGPQWSFSLFHFSLCLVLFLSLAPSFGLPANVNAIRREFRTKIHRTLAIVIKTIEWGRFIGNRALPLRYSASTEPVQYWHTASGALDTVMFGGSSATCHGCHSRLLWKCSNCCKYGGRSSLGELKRDGESKTARKPERVSLLEKIQY